ncbi:hypothetical protein CCYS_13740 [Corynebacterium cystitidis DSM 20524]|uniref:Uncharacterized protein n=1 Tax=Corynebacterium cystitidis DSM 20524 TaxID=1121357 RepID=A0A1H9V000_9CORY|nr:hypothetical protein CCYS_13740 [Corynebacterium cystitidis DSM 20524]SES14627.1 hypothetical protein SAMN05661109_02007 [Corynebacterium cystitidis DSM 20524]SNV91650.1 Uncharacterised protein [Corynebacterium cystitidis]
MQPPGLNGSHDNSIIRRGPALVRSAGPRLFVVWVLGWAVALPPSVKLPGVTEKSIDFLVFYPVTMLSAAGGCLLSGIPQYFPDPFDHHVPLRPNLMRSEPKRPVP